MKARGTHSPLRQVLYETGFMLLALEELMRWDTEEAYMRNWCASGTAGAARRLAHWYYGLPDRVRRACESAWEMAIGDNHPEEPVGAYAAVVAVLEGVVERYGAP